MKLTKLAAISTLAISVAGLTACNSMSPNTGEASQAPAGSQTVSDPAAEQAVSEMNVVQVAQSNADFSILVEAIQAAGLADALSNPDANFTVFAPTNEAFAEALEITGMSKEELFANKPLLTKLLGYHALNGEAPVYEADVQPGNITTLSQDTLTVTEQGQLQDENGRMANILQTDIEANNGVVHVIDKVLLPK
ncbi:MAG: fasciclin domain-containing protein [Moraxellaceae bacterium]